MRQVRYGKADRIAPYFSKEKGSPMVYSALFNMMLAIFMPMPNMSLILVLQLLSCTKMGETVEKCPKRCSLRSTNH